jgi:hypothetical protein
MRGEGGNEDDERRRRHARAMCGTRPAAPSLSSPRTHSPQQQQNPSLIFVLNAQQQQQLLVIPRLNTRPRGRDQKRLRLSPPNKLSLLPSPAPRKGSSRDPYRGTAPGGD